MQVAANEYLDRAGISSHAVWQNCVGFFFWFNLTVQVDLNQAAKFSDLPLLGGRTNILRSEFGHPVHAVSCGDDIDSCRGGVVDLMQSWCDFTVWLKRCTKCRICTEEMAWTMVTGWRFCWNPGVCCSFKAGSAWSSTYQEHSSNIARYWKIHDIITWLTCLATESFYDVLGTSFSTPTSSTLTRQVKVGMVSAMAFDGPSWSEIPVHAYQLVVLTVVSVVGQLILLREKGWKSQCKWGWIPGVSWVSCDWLVLHFEVRLAGGQQLRRGPGVPTQWRLSGRSQWYTQLQCRDLATGDKRHSDAFDKNHENKDGGRLRLSRVDRIGNWNHSYNCIVVYLDLFQKEVLQMFFLLIHTQSKSHPMYPYVSIASLKESISSMLLTRLSQSLVDLSGAASQSAAVVGCPKWDFLGSEGKKKMGVGNGGKTSGCQRCGFGLMCFFLNGTTNTVWRPILCQVGTGRDVACAVWWREMSGKCSCLFAGLCHWSFPVGCNVCLPFLSSSQQNDPSIHQRTNIYDIIWWHQSWTLLKILQDSCSSVGPIYSYLNHDVARCGPMAAEVYQVADFEGWWRMARKIGCVFDCFWENLTDLKHC